MKKKRKSHACNRLTDDHVSWVIIEHSRWKWWRALRRDITREMVKDFFKGFVARWLFPILLTSAGLKACEHVFG